MKNRLEEIADEILSNVSYLHFDEFVQVFGRRIVEECATISSGYNDRDWFEAGPELKKHFGVL